MLPVVVAYQHALAHLPFAAACELALGLLAIAFPIVDQNCLSMYLSCFCFTTALVVAFFHSFCSLSCFLHLCFSLPQLALSAAACIACALGMRPEQLPVRPVVHICISFCLLLAFSSLSRHIRMMMMVGSLLHAGSTWWGQLLPMQACIAVGDNVTAGIASQLA